VAAGNTFLIWKGGELGDFDLRLSFRCNATNNSGIQYRSKHITDDTAKNKWVVRGYQHEIRNEETFPNVSGFIYDEGGSRQRICNVGEQASWEAEGGKQAAATALIDQEAFKGLMKIDDWNDVVIRAEGNHIRHYLNGRLILDFTDNDPKRALTKGVLALQLHGVSQSPPQGSLNIEKVPATKFGQDSPECLFHRIHIWWLAPFPASCPSFPPDSAFSPERHGSAARGAGSARSSAAGFACTMPARTAASPMNASQVFISGRSI
jgi:hypothetical protein